MISYQHMNLMLDANLSFLKAIMTTVPVKSGIIRYNKLFMIVPFQVPIMLLSKEEWISVIPHKGNRSHMEVTEEFNRLYTQRLCSLKRVQYFSLWFQTYRTFCIFSSMICSSFCCHPVYNIYQKPKKKPHSEAEIPNGVWNEMKCAVY